MGVRSQSELIIVDTDLQAPGGTIISDIRPDVSRSTRHRVPDMLGAEQILVSAGHLPDPGFGHFAHVNGRRSSRGIWRVRRPDRSSSST